MTTEQTIAIRRLMEDAVRAASAANESAFLQAQLSELEAAVAHAEMATSGGHHGMIAGDDGLPGPFEPVYGESGVGGFGKGYVQVGGFTVISNPSGGHENPASNGQKIVAVKISVPTSSSSSGGSSGISIELVAYNDEAALLSAQQSLDYVIYPIYVLAWDEDGHSSITMDLRRMPTTGALETFLTNSSASGGSGS